MMNRVKCFFRLHVASRSDRQRESNSSCCTTFISAKRGNPKARGDRVKRMDQREQRVGNRCLTGGCAERGERREREEGEKKGKPD